MTKLGIFIWRIILSYLGGPGIATRALIGGRKASVSDRCLHPVLTEAPSTTAKPRKPPECPWTGGWVMSAYIHTMDTQP